MRTHPITLQLALTRWLVVLLWQFGFTPMTGNIMALVAPAAKPQHSATVADYLPADTAAVIEVNGVGEILDWMEDMSSEESDIFQAISSLAEEPFAVVHPERLSEALRLIRSISEALRSVDRLIVIVHDWTGELPAASLMIQIRDPDTLARLNADFDRLHLLLQAPAAPMSELPTIAPLPSTDSWFAKQWREFEGIGKWMLISNDFALIESIASRMDGEIPAEFKSLSGNRRHKIFDSQISRRANRNQLFSVYANPQRLRGLFASIEDAHWKALSVDEIPVAGGSVQLLRNWPRDKAVAIAITGFVQVTVPQVRLSRWWSALRPLEPVPRFAVNVNSLSAFSFDGLDLHRATESIFDGQHGPGKYEKAVTDQWMRMYGQDYDHFLKVYVPRSDGLIDVRYTTRFDNDGTLFLWHVRDAEAMRAYAELEIARLNRAKSDADFHFKLEEAEIGSIWSRSDAAIRAEHKWRSQNNRRNERLPQLTENRDTGAVQKDAFAFTPQWYLQGNDQTIRDQLRLLSGDDDVESQTNVQSKMDMARTKLNVTLPVCFVQYRSSVGWKHWVNRIQDLRIAAKYSSRQKQLEYMRRVNADPEFHLEIESVADRTCLAKWRVAKALVKMFGENIVFVSKYENGFQLHAAAYQPSPD